jgi:hypothetical protein
MLLTIPFTSHKQIGTNGMIPKLTEIHAFKPGSLIKGKYACCLVKNYFKNNEPIRTYDRFVYKFYLQVTLKLYFYRFK